MCSKLQWGDFFNRAAMKGFITSIAMAFFMQMTGVWIVTNYASLIFETSGSILDANTSAICLAIFQIIGGLLSTQLEFGRKTTLIVSLFGSAFGLITFAVYSYLRQIGYDVSSYLWLPVVCLSLVMFMASVGIVALANTCTVENFSLKVNIHNSKQCSHDNCFIFRFDRLEWRFILCVSILSDCQEKNSFQLCQTSFICMDISYSLALVVVLESFSSLL